jgi:hypothetical protein
MQYSGVSYGTNRTVMTGKSGIVGVNVIRLDKADESHKQNAEQRQHLEQGASVLLLSSAIQVDLIPTIHPVILQLGQDSCFMPNVHEPSAQ